MRAEGCCSRPAVRLLDSKHAARSSCKLPLSDIVRVRGPTAQAIRSRTATPSAGSRRWPTPASALRHSPEAARRPCRAPAGRNEPATCAMTASFRISRERTVQGCLDLQNAEPSGRDSMERYNFVMSVVCFLFRNRPTSTLSSVATCERIPSLLHIPQQWRQQ